MKKTKQNKTKLFCVLVCAIKHMKHYNTTLIMHFRTNIVTAVTEKEKEMTLTLQLRELIQSLKAILSPIYHFVKKK